MIKSEHCFAIIDLESLQIKQILINNNIYLFLKNKNVNVNFLNKIIKF